MIGHALYRASQQTAVNVWPHETGLYRNRCELVLVSSAIPIMSFSGIGVFKRFRRVQRYHAILYYVRKDVLCWTVDFVILQDLHHHTAVSVLITGVIKLSSY